MARQYTSSPCEKRKSSVRKTVSNRERSKERENMNDLGRDDDYGIIDGEVTVSFHRKA